MKFDRKAPGGGLEIETTVQNGKALFQCLCHLESVEENRESYLELRIWDRENRLVFRACHCLCREEPLKGMLLHPHLWQGVEDAYLYRVQAVLMKDPNHSSDLLERNLAFYHLCEIPMKGWFCNDNPIEIRAVKYEPCYSETVLGKEEIKDFENRLRKDLLFIRDMGANGIYIGEKESQGSIGNICGELGLLIWQVQGDDMPEFSQLQEQGFVTDLFYRYKARWSKEPFVYLSKESMVFEAGGTVRVTVYSNQSKVALYTEGELFEFRKEGPDFVFEGIPVKQLPVLLTAETGACSMSLSAHPVHKMFTI